MPELVFHPHTGQQLAVLSRRPPHAILLSAPAGTGKASTAYYLAEKILELPPGKLADYAYVRLIAPTDNKAISIDDVRELEHFLALKTPSGKAVSRAAVITDAHLLTVEAQNALLKTLEEPPAGTVLIMTSAHDQALLPTIRSRLQAVAIKRPRAADLEAHLKLLSPASAKLKQALAMGGGLPGLSVALVAGDDSHPLVQAATVARQLLPKTPYERLLMVDVLVKDRQACQNVLFILEQMAHAALLSEGKATKRWQAVLKAAYDAQEQLLANAQPKLVMANLMLKL